MKILRETYWFFSGKYQAAPDWYDRLPPFFWPVYIGLDRFRWCGIVIKVKYPMAGETLLMAWRRHLGTWLNAWQQKSLLWMLYWVSHRVTRVMAIPGPGYNSRRARFWCWAHSSILNRVIKRGARKFETQ